MNQSANGFTLIETLVALAILSLSLGVIMVGLRVGVRGVGAAADGQESLALASSLLAAEGTATPLRYGDVSGSTADGVRWEVVTTPWGDGEAGPKLAAGYQIDITITNQGHILKFSTLRAGPVANAAN
jgi:general secretion pathway protein I